MAAVQLLLLAGALVVVALTPLLQALALPVKEIQVEPALPEPLVGAAAGQQHLDKMSPRLLAAMAARAQQVATADHQTCMVLVAVAVQTRTLEAPGLELAEQTPVVPLRGRRGKAELQILVVVVAAEAVQLSLQTTPAARAVLAS